MIDLKELAGRMVKTVRNGGTNEEIKQEFMRSAKLLMEDALALLREQEPVIVRCKDCKYRFENLRCYANNPMVGRLVDGDWFCADGERRGEAEDR